MAMNPFIFPSQAAAAEPMPRSCYANSGAAGVIVTAAALMSRVQLVVERITSLEHFEALVEQGVVDEVTGTHARLHFMRLGHVQPLDVILPAVEVGPKKGSA